MTSSFLQPNGSVAAWLGQRPLAESMDWETWEPKSPVSLELGKLVPLKVSLVPGKLVTLVPGKLVSLELDLGKLLSLKLDLGKPLSLELALVQRALRLPIA